MLDLSVLDHNNPDHFDEDKRPKLSVVRKLLDDKNISRADIDATGCVRGNPIAPPRPFELHDALGRLNVTVSDKELKSWPPERQQRWADLAVASTAEHDADAELTAASTEVSQLMRDLQAAEQFANVVRIGREHDLILSDADKLALKSKDASIRALAQQRAAEIEQKLKTATEQDLEGARLIELRRVQRAYSGAPVPPKELAEQTARDERSAKANAIMSDAESKLAASRQRLQTAKAEQRSARAMVASAVGAWMADQKPKSPEELRREHINASQAHRVALAKGEIEPPPPPPAPRWPMDAKYASRPRQFPNMPASPLPKRPMGL